MKKSYTFIVIGFVIIGFFLWQRFLRSDHNLPLVGQTRTEQIIDEQTIAQTVPQEKTRSVITREAMITNGVRHSIPLEEILQGCPSRDCILSIDDPTFESPIDAMKWLDDVAPGIAFSRGDTHRFYPYDILVSREIVNDTVEGERVLISYCPLCLTAVVFDPLVQGERVEFGVSGLLWKSNLIMYDRKSETYWSQVLGEAVMGDLTGIELTILPSDQVLFGKWKQAFPNGEVLGSEFLRGIGRSGNPYAETHLDVSGTAISFARPSDARLPFGSHVFGIIVNGKAKAYSVDLVRERGMVRDEFEGKTIELRLDPILDVVRMFEILPDGSEQRVKPLSGFWFSWAEAHPETELYQ
jgi:hypothetical protein